MLTMLLHEDPTCSTIPTVPGVNAVNVSTVILLRPVMVRRRVIIRRMRLATRRMALATHLRVLPDCLCKMLSTPLTWRAPTKGEVPRRVTRDARLDL